MQNPTCWIEVDLAAIRHNFREIERIVAPARVIAVVKANAYGHGAAAVSLSLEKENVAIFAVTKLDEAQELRDAGVQKPILLLAPLPKDQIEAAIKMDLTACISDSDDAAALSEIAVHIGKIAKAHLKIDTGMGRFGVDSSQATAIAKQISSLPNLEISGVYTHFANATNDGISPSAQEQFSEFQLAMQSLQQELGFPAEMFHCANSAATLRFPQMRLQCVRVGTLLYGQYPSALVRAAAPRNFQLRDTFRAKARVVAVKKIKSGKSVGYGSEWMASKDTNIAIVAAGFADGLSMTPHARTETFESFFKSTSKQVYHALRGNSDARLVTIHGQRAPIVGRIAMQVCAVDVGQMSEVKTGDEVILPMRRLAASAKLPRIYSDNPETS